MSRLVHLRKNNKGRGVYARLFMLKGEVVIEDPVLVFPDKDARPKGVIHRYTFEWDDGVSALAMGLGSYVNHSYKPNVFYRHDRSKQTIVFVTLRTVEAGEELLMNYNHDPDDMSPVGFDVKR